MHPYIPWGDELARRLATLPTTPYASERIAHIGPTIAEGLIYLSESVNFF